MLLTMCILGLCLLAGSMVWMVSKDYALWALAVAVGLALMVFSIGQQRVKSVNETFAKEVSLTQVPVSGQKNFRAQVQISYKDGELNSVVLVPKTTVAEVVTAK
ncbi:MAG: hypothetical protein PHP62_02265 [Candidatus Moranbacteria bacterium]|nr:hypothetical protein [Candidatus Moranbacteria bacterium]